MLDYAEITPPELRARLERGEAVRVIDVREPPEFEVARVAGAELLPLSEFARWAGSLEPEEEIVVMCHHGMRSAHVCRLLAARGFRQLHNLTGGIDRWSVEVDPRVPRY